MAQSIPVVTGNDATADEYNDLRDDVLDPIVGHDHEGVDGKVLDGGVAIAAGTITEDRLATALTNKLMNFRTQAPVVTGINNSLTTVLNVASGKGILNALVFRRGTNAFVPRVRITVDGVVIIDDSGVSQDNEAQFLSAQGTLQEQPVGQTAGEPTPESAIQIWFTTSLLVEVQNAGNGSSSEILHAIQV